MTPEPVVLTGLDDGPRRPLARARNYDVTPALSSMVFVVRPPTATSDRAVSRLRPLAEASP